MSIQNIDAAVSAADLQAIKDAFATIKEKLPFLTNLTVDERRATFKAGSGSLAFVQKTLTAAETYSQVLPDSFDKAAFRRDVELFGVLTQINTDADSLTSQIDDTRLATGGEAMKAATQVYRLLQASEEIVPGLKTVVEELSERFQRAGKAKAEATSGKAEAASGSTT
jgi:hypothetical protein